MIHRLVNNNRRYRLSNRPIPIIGRYRLLADYRCIPIWETVLQVKKPNQQYQSTEGKSCKGKNKKNTKKTQITHMHAHTK